MSGFVLVSHYYNVHNIVKIRSEVVLYELEYFRCDDPLDNNPDLVIDVAQPIIPRTLFKRKLMVEDENAEMTNLKYTEHLGIFGAQFRIQFKSTKVFITVNNLIASSKHVLYVNLVEPILRFMLLIKGYMLLHSACIADKAGNGLLLSAPPDTGKTTTVLKCLKAGFSFLSDDMTILKLPDIALSFPKPMTISSHTFNTATTISNGSNASGSSSLKIRSIVHSKKGRQFMRSLGRHDVPIFTFNTVGQAIIRPPKFKVEDLLQKFSTLDSTAVKRIMFLEKGSEENASIDNNVALQKATENSDDAFLFPPYQEILQNLRINNKTGKELLDLERSLLSKFLSNVECITSKSNSKAWFEHIVQSFQITAPLATTSPTTASATPAISSS